MKIFERIPPFFVVPADTAASKRSNHEGFSVRRTPGAQCR